ncbi:hypothetical protein C8E05_1570 [Rhodococcus wratislaviensis]|uniref:Phage protein n=1 Tax=Rhodococcus wratislaviensis TaxID=44752 RepID=A0AB38FGW9_RHOWR|nr:hypothetical protein [Rhodococcus wratislaviensis]REE72182.1 hypothetical protein C8E05_1570 [Rhodococcus wratislaviensis]SPZ40802.1 Uncharacterised protein [Rhodococcus wratislaviensis]
MTTQYMKVSRIANWTSTLDVKLPKSLDDALAAYDALRYVETGHEPVIDPTKLKAAGVAAEVERVAKELSVNAHLEEAQQRIAGQLESRIIREAAAAVPSVLDQLTEKFDAQAARYVAAAVKLPLDLTSESVVETRDAEVLAALGEATEAAGFLEKVDNWLESLGELPGYSTNPNYEPVLRVTAPDDYKPLYALREAHQARHTADTLLQSVGPVYFAAARNGVEFKMLTPDESTQLLQDLEDGKPLTAGQRFIGVRR